MLFPARRKLFKGFTLISAGRLATTSQWRSSDIRRKAGFTLIELLIVITLFAITSSLITASYITFEKNQRIRNAAQTLKNDLRFTQNKSLAGDKGVSNVSSSDCTDTSGTSQCCPNHLGSDDSALFVLFLHIPANVYEDVCAGSNVTAQPTK